MPGICESLLEPGLCQAVDLYCERTSADLLAEPLNALSNLAFVLAGWAGWREFRQSDVQSSSPLLAAIVALGPIIGVGSLLFHTLATRWAGWADVIPILGFMLLYLWLSFRCYLGWPTWLASLSLVAFFLSTIVLEIAIPERVLWGGAMYLPTIATYLAIVFAPIGGPREVRRSFVVAVCLFLVGFAFRTLDLPLCGSVVSGVHYLWHVSNAIVLYLLVHAAILHGAAPLPRKQKPEAQGV